MKLKNNLYKIISTDKETRQFLISLLPDSEIYRAHFPEEPVTPGVCVIQMATEIIEDELGESLRLKAIANAKFLAVISPMEVQEVIYRIKKQEREGDIVKSQIVVSDKEGKIFSKLSLEHILG